jgi:hypothetical protein
VSDSDGGNSDYDVNNNVDDEFERHASVNALPRLGLGLGLGLGLRLVLGLGLGLKTVYYYYHFYFQP